MRTPWLLYFVLTGVLGAFIFAAALAKQGNPWPLFALSVAWLSGYAYWNHLRKPRPKPE